MVQQENKIEKKKLKQKQFTSSFLNYVKKYDQIHPSSRHCCQFNARVRQRNVRYNKNQMLAECCVGIKKVANLLREKKSPR